jgi:hypothetical protein
VPRLPTSLPLLILLQTPAAAVAQPAAAPPSPPPSPEAEPAPTVTTYSLTVRGGVSLGSYEGGLNWAFLTLLKRDTEHPSDLVTVTGASAGNINAFLSAATWCQRADIGETPTTNLFWDAWIDIGMSELFPGPALEPGEGLFTRKAFEKAESTFLDVINQPGRFRPTCPLALGVSVTRIRPATLRLKTANNDGGIPIDTQRFVAAYNVDVSSSKLRFRGVDHYDPEVGLYLNLPTEGGALGDGQIKDIIHASSAFPVAFAPVLIEHCDDASAAPCTETQEDKFIDGGVFDNVPLGLATSLTRQVAKDRAANVTYLYLDPGHERRYDDPGAKAAADKQAVTDERVGLKSTFDFVSNFVNVAQQYELQAVARYLYKPTDGGDTSKLPAPRLSSRFHPLFGSYYGHFGAFLAKPFRQHDFFVGIYDALADAARTQCGIDTGAGKGLTPQQAGCFARKVRRGHEIIGLDDPTTSPAASYVVRRLLAEELQIATGGPLTPSADPRGGVSADDIAWLDARKTLTDQDGGGAGRVTLMRALLDALHCGAEGGDAPAHCSARVGTAAELDDFTDVVAASGRRWTSASSASGTTSRSQPSTPSCARRANGCATRRWMQPSAWTRSNGTTATAWASISPPRRR